MVGGGGERFREPGRGSRGRSLLTKKNPAGGGRRRQHIYKKNKTWVGNTVSDDTFYNIKL